MCVWSNYRLEQITYEIMIPLLKSRAWLAVLAGLLLQLPATLRAQPADKSASLFSDPVVATGKGFEIKRSQVDDAYIDYSAAEAARGRTVPEQDRAEIRAKVLDHLIISKILLQKATEDDKSNVLKLVEAEIAQARSNAPSPAAFDQQIKAKGLTLAQVRDQEVEKPLTIFRSRTPRSKSFIRTIQRNSKCPSACMWRTS
jgi:predicted transcriptional regulator